ncbi:SpoIID/LytB domain-containing protein [Terrabacter sp. AAH1]
MRVIPSSIAVVALSSALVVVPTVTTGAAPRPVSPSVHEMRIPTVAAASARTSSARSTGEKVVASGQVSGVDFDLAGVTFDRNPPAGTKIEVRTHGPAGWSGWNVLGLGDDGPDPGSPDALHARPGTEPITVPGSDAIDVRVSTPDGSVPSGVRASLVDGGESPADGNLAAPAGSAVASVTKPTIITRAQWGADESLSTCTPGRLTGFKAVVIHHTVNANTYTADQAASIIRSIYAYHTKSQGWCDLGYQILVDRFGRAYEGRKGSTTGFVQGAQVGGFNADTTGISVIGDFTSVPFPAATQDTVTRLVAWEADRSLFDPTSSVTLTSAGGSKYPAGAKVTVPRTVGHRDLSLTGCPGDTAYAKQIAPIRSNAGPLWKAGQWRPVASQTAVETYPLPASAAFALSGAGFGHGIGMSQWGAYGAATKGLTWQQILAFYYPGTTLGSQGSPALRVWLSALGTAAPRFAKQTGLTVTDGRRTAKLAATASWRTVAAGSNLDLQYLSGSTWVTSSTWRASTVPFTFSRGTSPVRTVLPGSTQRDYPGFIRVVPSAGKALAVNVVPFETYLRSVVPVEMSPSWPAAALTAQAVAARSYAASQRADAGSRVYDTCDVSCQVYKGSADYSSAGALQRTWADARSTAAVQASAGLVLSYGGKPALTQFSASNGGWSHSGSVAYLPAQSDPYDGVVASTSNPRAWTRSLTAIEIQRAYPSIGTLRTLAIPSRTGGTTAAPWGGRTASVTLSGASGSVTVSGDSFRSALALKSTLWTVSSAPDASTPYAPRDVSGDGRADAVIPFNGGLLALVYTGSMGFATKSISSSATSGMKTVAAVGALTPDSLGDVVTVATDGTAWVYPGMGARGLAASRAVLARGWTTVNLVIGAGDWDGDGYTDVLTRHTSGDLTLWKGDGMGHLVSQRRIGTSWNGLAQVTSGDFDGDGHVDLMGVRASDGALVFYSNTGAGGFRSPRVVDGSNWLAMTAVRGIGDLTGDGRTDLVARRISDGKLLVYRVVDSARVAVSPLDAGVLSNSSRWGQ